MRNRCLPYLGGGSLNLAHGGLALNVARERGWNLNDVLDLSASINPFGPAPGVREAITGALDKIVHYPDPYSPRLTKALAEHWGVDQDSILCGNGATELIHFLARVWPQPTTLAVPVFSEFHRAYPHAKLAGSQAKWPKRGLLVLTNPVNPTGSETLTVDRTGYTMVDESFIEFTELPSAAGTTAIVLRSLTKFYALPGLRIGAVVAPPALVRHWKRTREPWQVNILAEEAALAALADKDHAAKTKDLIDAERARLWAEFQDLEGVTLHPTHANFYLARLSYPAQQLCDFLLESKILVRNCTGWPGVEGQAIRFAISTAENNDRLLEQWRQYCVPL